MAGGSIPHGFYIEFYRAGNDLNYPPDFLSFLRVSENTSNTPSQLSGTFKRGLVISCPYGNDKRFCSQVFISAANLDADVFVRAQRGNDAETGDPIWGEWKQLAFAE